MNIKGAIFDMDGTLVDSLMFWDVFWERLGIKYLGVENFKPDEEIDKKVRTMIFTDAVKYMKTAFGIAVDEDELVEFGTSSLADFYRYEVGVKAGAFELIRHLKALGVKTCIASATDLKYVRIALESTGLSEHFDTVMSCADIGIGKDRPDIYLKASKALSLPIEDICVFEDSYVALETAKNAGFQTVGIFDKYNFGQDRLEAASDIYLKEGFALDSLIDKIN